MWLRTSTKAFVAWLIVFLTTLLLTTSAVSQDTRTITHALGETEIPASPVRVLALGEEGLLLDLLLAGIKPVASNANIPEAIPLVSEGELEGVELFPSAGQVSLEVLQSFQPDLIIGATYFIEELGYDLLSEIAPTVAINGDTTLASYQETFRIFGNEDEALANIERLKQRIKAEGETLEATTRTLSVVTVYPGPNVAAWLDGPLPLPELLLELGFSLRPALADVEGLGLRQGRVFLSLEQLPLLDAETILLLQSNLVEGEEEAALELGQHPLWLQLPAVKNERVLSFDRLGYPGFRGYEKLLGDVVTVLREE